MYCRLKDWKQRFMKEDKEDCYLMISGIQHFSFCRRQWALIHVEQQWSENLYTVEGKFMHERVHDEEFREKRKDIICTGNMPIVSERMKVRGNCDLVEFRKSESGIHLQKYEGEYEVFPVEYKHGSSKEYDADLLQLTAQAMCLEEMFSCSIPKGALFYGSTRRREEVLFTEQLREKTEQTFREMHQYFREGYTPKVKWSKSCNACSLKDICVPALGKKNNVKKYVEEHITEAE